MKKFVFLLAILLSVGIVCFSQPNEKNKVNNSKGYMLNIYVNVTVFLEGPFDGTDMNTYLSDLDLIPPGQPYYTPPWNYPGTESLEVVPTLNMVDWVLIELRDAVDAPSAIPATAVAMQAAIVLNDGSVVGMDGSSNLEFDLEITNQLFVVVRHRNHLGMISAYPLNESAGTYSYDFTNASSQAYANNQSNLGGGKYGMISGNTNADAIINEFDRIQTWSTEAGQSGYLLGDVNLDGQVENPDKNDIWFPNFGKYEHLPGSAFIACGTELYDDRNGEYYTTIQIGDQCWMSQNLNIGTMITSTSNASNNGIIEKYCVNNTLTNCDTYGGFYQWDELMEYSTEESVQGICPTDWHLPSDSEWCNMELHLDSTVVCDNTLWRGTDIGTQLKQGGTSGFEALTPGYRNFNGTFEHFNFGSYFWTSTQTTSYLALCRYLWGNQTGVSRWAPDQIYGYSVRCVLDGSK